VSQRRCCETLFRASAPVVRAALAEKSLISDGLKTRPASGTRRIEFRRIGRCCTVNSIRVRWSSLHGSTAPFYSGFMVTVWGIHEQLIGIAKRSSTSLNSCGPRYRPKALWHARSVWSPRSLPCCCHIIIITSVVTGYRAPCAVIGRPLVNAALSRDLERPPSVNQQGGSPPPPTQKKNPHRRYRHQTGSG